MFDLLGVGICIACISYLCCIYTTTFVALSTTKRCKKCPTRPQVIRRHPVVVCKEDKEKPAQSTYTVSSDTVPSRRRCPCAEVGCAEQKILLESVKAPGRRKLCLVAASFLNFDATDSECNGAKCKRLDEGICYCSTGGKHSSCEFLRNRGSRQSECRI